MARRVTLPTADDLFRPTAPGVKTAERRRRTQTDPGVGLSSRTAQPSVRAVPDAGPEPALDEREPDTGSEQSEQSADAAKKRASGRIKHDEKMTVYVTPDELLDLERTRLELRAVHGLAVDRGRLVREAIDLVLADFHEHGSESMLVRGLLDE